MKVFIGIGTDTLEHHVHVEDEDGKRPLPIRTPTGLVYPHSEGHAWGYGGSGPTQLAHDILYEVYGESVPRDRYMQFKFDKIATLSPKFGWRMEEEEVREAYDRTI